MTKVEKSAKIYPSILEQGYRPIGRLDTHNPPQGGSGVPSKLTNRNPRSPSTQQKSK